MLTSLIQVATRWVMGRGCLILLLALGGCHKVINERSHAEAGSCASHPDLCDAAVANPLSPVMMAMTCPLDGSSVRTSIRADGGLWHSERVHGGVWSGVAFFGRTPNDVREFMYAISDTGIYSVRPDSYHSPPFLTACTLSLRNLPPREGYVDYVWSGASTIPNAVMDAHRIFSSFINR